ncbi:hypothetical protein [Gimibacter soli]|uniref:DUF2946 domain-containing protein n=1 Tax=Gimibacter soli TaxID=3024400 RepID=A0AAE9XQN1_9PROT|nr:hypothetical protein [Gimibacter soli]WCL55422.1 hypothetical protein PH603_06575 [Gimibacter soli]
MYAFYSQMRHAAKLMRLLHARMPVLAVAMLVVWQGIVGASVMAGDNQPLGGRPAALSYVVDGERVQLPSSLAYCNFSDSETDGKGACPDCAGANAAALVTPILSLPRIYAGLPVLPAAMRHLVGIAPAARSARDPPLSF